MNVQTNEPTICSDKTTIQADDAKKNDFGTATDVLLITVPYQKRQVPSNNAIRNPWISISVSYTEYGTA